MNINTINKNNDIIVFYKELLKENNNEFIATDDINIITLALEYNIPIKEFFYCNELDYHKETKQLIEKITNYANNTSFISKKTFESLANKGNCVGLFAIIKVTNSGFDKINGKKFIVVCDGLEIPGNLGTIYRTMDSALVEAVILVNSVTHPFNNKNTIASRGCNLLVPTWETSFEDALKYLKDNNFNVYLGEPILGKCYKDYDYSNNVAIVVGNERFGIDKRWYDETDDNFKKVFIPMFGSNNSLNVGVAASILIYEAKLKRN